MQVKFYFHPDRTKEIGTAIMLGTLTAYPHQLVESSYLPLVDREGKDVLGWWMKEMEPSDWFRIGETTWKTPYLNL